MNIQVHCKAFFIIHFATQRRGIVCEKRLRQSKAEGDVVILSYRSLTLKTSTTYSKITFASL